MSQVTARLPEQLAKRVDRAARQLRRSRADIIRRAIEYYLEDVEDLRIGLDRLQDPADTVLDWDKVRRELLSQD